LIPLIGPATALPRGPRRGAESAGPAHASCYTRSRALVPHRGKPARNWWGVRVRSRRRSRPPRSSWRHRQA